MRGSITKAGNTRARCMLVEGAWTHKLPARVSQVILKRAEELRKEIRAIAWRAQVRLCQRYRRMQAGSRPTNIVVVAIACELAAFVWATATTVPITSTIAVLRTSAKHEDGGRFNSIASRCLLLGVAAVQGSPRCDSANLKW